MIRLLTGDCREVLKTLPDNSVSMCLTSPPYYGLRDYGVAGQIGLEPTPTQYIASLVAVFAEVKRVLHPSGTVWLNLGDSFASGKGTCHNPGGGANSLQGHADLKDAQAYPLNRGNVSDLRKQGLKPKDLMMIPARVAIALQDDGWWLRSEIVWAKKAPMPESVTDRCTRSHEMVYMLTKNARYFCDMEAVREPNSPETQKYFERYTPEPFKSGNGDGTKANELKASGYGNTWVGAGSRAQVTSRMNPAGRNCRDVWFLSPEPFSGKSLGLDSDHFAVFPTEMARRCIAMGTSERGCCSRCGAPWERVVEKGEPQRMGGNAGVSVGHSDGPMDRGGNGQWDEGHMPMVRPTTTTGWRPTCECNAGDPVPCTVLDPFAGSGTVGLVADRLGRDAILIDLNPEYSAMQRERVTQDAPMFAEVTQ